MKNASMAARRAYLELTALLIEREIARFRRGEQTALVSFSNVAVLAGNAREELMAAAVNECAATVRPRPCDNLHRRSA
jgi:hypothetical protein